ncbi:hypothetical protein QEN19_003305 [Hanseniaspora menglaensis]
MSSKKSKLRQSKSNDQQKTAIYINEKKLLKIYGQSEVEDEINDKFICSYYCKSCIDVDVDTVYIFSKPFKASEGNFTKTQVFMHSLELYFEKHPSNCTNKNNILNFIRYKNNDDETLSHSVCSFSFELLKKLDTYNLIVKQFNKHLCLNIFDLEKKTKAEIFCGDCRYKTSTSMPLNITETSSLPLHDCSTGAKNVNKKRSFSALVHNNEMIEQRENNIKKQKRILSEQVKGSDKLFEEGEKYKPIGEIDDIKLKVMENLDTIKVGNDKSTSLNLNSSANAAQKALLKDKVSNKSQLLIAKGKKKIQKKNSKKQMSIVDILQKNDNNEVNVTINSKELFSKADVINGKDTSRSNVDNSFHSSLAIKQKHINPENGDLILEQVSRLMPITDLDFSSETISKGKTKFTSSGDVNSSLASSGVVLGASLNNPRSKQFNLFTRKVSSQPLLLNESFLSEEEEDKKEEKENNSINIETNNKADIEVEQADFSKNILSNNIENSIFKVDINLDSSNESSSLLNVSKPVEQIKKPGYILLASKNVNNIKDVATDDEDNEIDINRVISNISVDFAKLNDVKNLKNKSKKNLTPEQEISTTKTPTIKSRQASMIETLKSPLLSRKKKSPIQMHSNSPKRNGIIDDKSDIDMRNISLRSTAIHSPRLLKNKFKSASPSKSRRLDEDNVQLFKADAYEGILNFSQINANKLEEINSEPNIKISKQEHNQLANLKAKRISNHSTDFKENIIEGAVIDHVTSQDIIAFDKDITSLQQQQINEIDLKNTSNEYQKNISLNGSDILDKASEISQKEISNSLKSISKDVESESAMSVIRNPVMENELVVTSETKLIDIVKRNEIASIKTSLETKLTHPTEKRNHTFHVDNPNQHLLSYDEEKISEKKANETIENISAQNLESRSVDSQVSAVSTKTSSPIFTLRNKALFLQSISNLMSLSIISPHVLNFQQKMLNFKSIILAEKQEHEDLITKEYQLRKQYLIDENLNLQTKVENCDNLENLLKLYQKLVSK